MVRSRESLDEGGSRNGCTVSALMDWYEGYVDFVSRISMRILSGCNASVDTGRRNFPFEV